MSIFDVSGGKLEKLTIQYESARATFDERHKFAALFNPNQLRYDNRAEWRATSPITPSIAAGFQRMEFQATPPGTLEIDLFFDTYEGVPSSAEGNVLSRLVPDNPLTDGKVRATAVTEHTQRVANLAQVASELHRPPVCRLSWGETTLFQGVLTGLRQDLTFFLPNGTPVRATLSCTFTEYRTFAGALKNGELHSSDVAKRRVIRRGDTLTAIAIEQYGDATRWRDIASANAIDDPRALTPGQVLVIPKLVS